MDITLLKSRFDRTGIQIWKMTRQHPLKFRVPDPSLLWTQCASALGVEHFGGVKNSWHRMTDFGLKNYVVDVKTLSDHNSAPFWSWNFIFGHNVVQHCFMVTEKFWLRQTNFELKTTFLALKHC